MSDKARDVTGSDPSSAEISDGARRDDWYPNQIKLGAECLFWSGEDRASKLEEAIDHFNRALLGLTKEPDEKNWLMAQLYLGLSYYDRALGDPVQNQYSATECLATVLRIVTPESSPEMWAQANMFMGNAYLKLEDLEDPARIELAIECFEKSLFSLTQSMNARAWSETLSSLGAAYLRRTDGLRTANIERSIECLLSALEARSSDRSPLDWALIETDLGLALLERPEEDRAQCLQTAIDHLKSGLEEIPRDDFPGYWVRCQTRLGLAYMESLTGERADNLERAIRHLSNALEVLSGDESPEQWARLQHDLGAAYLARGSSGSAGDLHQALACFHRALRVFDRQYLPREWALAQAHLGSVHLLLSDLGRTEDSPLFLSDRPIGSAESTKHLEAALRYFGKSLKVFSLDAHPSEWASVQEHLGNVYYLRAGGDRTRNVERAITCFENALSFFNSVSDASRCSGLNNKLGCLYFERNIERRSDNLERAIDHFKSSLEGSRTGEEQFARATRDYNLGLVFAERIRGDSAENIRTSIKCLETALQAFDREVAPIEWARTQNALGNTHARQSRGESSESIELSIQCFNNALEEFSREKHPVLWARTQHSLGAAYHNRIEGQRSDNFEQAIECFDRALEVRTFQTDPQSWASTQENLGIVYRDRILGERIDNYGNSLEAYERALQVRTLGEFPFDWARIQQSLGYLYRNWRENPGSHDQAVAHFRRALEIFTAQSFPQRCRDAAYALGVMLYEAQQYQGARLALKTAHEAVEALRGETQRQQSRRNLAEENANLYAHLVHCCLLDGQTEAAFSFATAAKGRAFLDYLVSSRVDFSAASAENPELAAYMSRARELRQEIDSLLAILMNEFPSHLDGHEHDFHSSLDYQLAELQEEERRIWEDAAFSLPALMASKQAEVLSAEDAMNLAKETHATLVEYYRHAGGWGAFLITPSEFRYVSLPSVDEDQLVPWLNWLWWIESPFGRGSISTAPLKHWHEAFVSPLSEHLPKERPIVLAPFSWLNLLPMGAFLDPNTGRFVTDDFVIAFAPSIAALNTFRDRDASLRSPQEIDSGHEALCVAFPGTEGSRYYLREVLREANAVARHFRRAVKLFEDEATIDAVLKTSQGKSVIHFGCHGSFDFDHSMGSGLLLSNGWLTVQRIVTDMNLDQTHLTTVAACLSGRIEVRPAEEHIGIVQSLLTAGSRAVISALWSVNDRATRALFEAIYGLLEAGNSTAQSVCLGAQMIRNQGDWVHPYYWAAFQASGLALDGLSPFGLIHVADPEGAVSSVSIENQFEKQSRDDADEAVTQMFEDAEIILSQLSLLSDEWSQHLTDPEICRVADQVDDLLVSADHARDMADLLIIVDSVHRLVEETSSLREQLLQPDVDTHATQASREVAIRGLRVGSARTSTLPDQKSELISALVDLRDVLTSKSMLPTGA